MLKGCEPFTAPVIEEKIKSFIAAKNLGKGQIMNAWRITLVGTSKGPGLTEIAEILGKEKVIRRILRAVETIKI